jgi:hypothetical protein
MNFGPVNYWNTDASEFYLRGTREYLERDFHLCLLKFSIYNYSHISFDVIWPLQLIGQRRYWGFDPRQGRDVPLRHKFYTNSRVKPVSYRIVMGNYFCGGNLDAAWIWPLTSNTSLRHYGVGLRRGVVFIFMNQSFNILRSAESLFRCW